MTEDGLLPIAELVISDIVLAYNEDTGELDWYPITATMAHLDPVIIKLTIDGELIETTPEHPFMIMEAAPWLAMGQVAGRWVDAGELELGDDVWRADGSTGDVEAVVVVPVQQWMYNLTVDVAHTFFVGQQGWLVHNGCINFSNAKELARRLGVNEKIYHAQIKKHIIKDPDIAPLLRKINSTNPDIGINDLGNIVLKNPSNGKTIESDIPLESFRLD